MACLPRILVADDSRMVRTSLAHHLSGFYEIREEVDGEAAWQALEVDHEIVAVIAEVSLPRLDGFALLERIRASRAVALQAIPVILVAGKSGEDDKVRAQALGVSDFITDDIGPTELRTRLEHLLRLNAACQRLEEEREQLVHDPESGLFTRKYLEMQVVQGLSQVARHGGELSFLAFGFDDYEDVCQQLGQELAEHATLRFAKLLTSKIRQGDSLGHFAPGQFGIVSPSTGASVSLAFANRVRQAVEVAQVAAQGQRLSLTVSIGLVTVPLDQVSSGSALLALAEQRLAEAMRQGGNRIIGGGAAPVPVKAMSLQQAAELLKAGRTETVRLHLPQWGAELLPLLRLLENELSVGLPLAALDVRLGEFK